MSEHTGTETLLRERLPNFEEKLNAEKKLSETYAYDYVDFASENIISMLAEGLKKNQEIKKKRFLHIVRNRPDFQMYPGINHDKSESAAYNYVADKANELIKKTSEELKELLSKSDDSMKLKLKGYLYTGTRQKVTGYVNIKRDTIVKWFTRNTPSRSTLFLISFALNLPLAETEKDYSTHESLFYRSFGQRSFSRNADEVCMIFCKKNGLSYTTALRLYLEFLKRTEIKKETDSVDATINKPIGTGTIRYNIDVNLKGCSEEEFLDFLVKNALTLDFKYSSIDKKMQELMDAESLFGDLSGKETEYQKEVNSKYKTIINRLSKDVRSRIDSGREVTGAFPKKNLFKDTEKGKEAEKEYFEDNDPERYDRYNCLMKYSRDVFLFYEFFHDTDYLSRDYYTGQRKKWIFLSFLAYWNKCNKHGIKSKDIFDKYIKSTNRILKENFFSELLIYNDFDFLFILCAKSSDPIESFLFVLTQISDLRYDILEALDKDDES